MVLVFKDNGIVELRDDDGRQTIRVFHDVKSCDEHWGKALLLLTYQSHNSVELRSSRNGLVKITSKQLLLSEEQRLLTPLQGAHEQDKSKHPKWSLIYQSYKHDQANTQSSDSELRPTFKDVLEAAGAAFMLLVVAQSLPLNKAKQFVQCDLSFGSDLFAATYTRPLFTTFTAPLSAEDLQLAPNWQQAMFVVKDPERYIEYLCKEQKAKNKQFIDAILSTDREEV